MTALDYVKHYISMPDCAIFFGLAFVLIVLVNLILFLCAKIKASSHTEEGLTKEDSTRKYYATWIQYFYELFFSSSSILFFISVYYLLNRFYNVQPYKSYLLKYDSLLLLVLIIISCILTTLMDRVFVKLNLITSENRGPIRFMGMIYMAFIFWYIKVIYENDNYDNYIIYFLGLMIGRFAYFDSSFKDFWYTIKEGFKIFPLVLLALGVISAMSYYGFKTEFLIKHIGVITNVYIEHIFLCVAIFIIHHLHPEKWGEKNERNMSVE